MSILNNPQNLKLDKNGKLSLPAHAIPSFRAQLAVQNGLQKNFLIWVAGGIGDAICAEPSIRWALSKFTDCKFTLATEHIDLFRHLFDSRFLDNSLVEIIDLKTTKVSSHDLMDNYYVFKTLVPSGHLQAEFIPHMFTHCIDYHSQTMWRTQLEPHEKDLLLLPNVKEFKYAEKFDVLIHPGLSWPTRTFPREWWQEVADRLKQLGLNVGMIGGVNEGIKGTWDIDGITDLRMRPLMDSVALCHKAKLVITNDSAPLHMAASSSQAFVAYLSTVKRPDLLAHYRCGQAGYRMKNFSRDGQWSMVNMNPNNNDQIRFDLLGMERMTTHWLPTPHDFIESLIREDRRIGFL